MKKIRLFAISVTIFILSILITNTVFAAPPFLTLAQVQNLISTAIAPVQSALGDLTGRVEDLENSTPVSPSTEEIVFFPIGNLTHGQESSVIDTKDHKVVFIDVKWESGGGGFHIFYSDDQISWVLQGDISGNSNDPVRQKAFPTKGKFYKIIIVSSFKGEATGFLY